MNEKSILEKTEEARRCMERAVHDELVKKAVIINREGKPYKIPAAEALRRIRSL